MPRVSSEVAASLEAGTTVESALASGTLTREKVRARWLYLPAEDTLAAALDRVETAACSVLDEWLLAQGPHLVGQTAKLTADPQPSPAACRLLLHELCARQRLDGIAQMTRSLQPHLAFFSPRDRPEIERQVEAMRELLRLQGQVDWHDLPEPRRAVRRKTWRMHVLAHGEWLGLGHLCDRVTLLAW